MSMDDVVELLKKTKVSRELLIDAENLKEGFIESLKVIQSDETPEEDLTEVAKIVDELLNKRKNNH